MFFTQDEGRFGEFTPEFKPFSRLSILALEVYAAGFGLCSLGFNPERTTFCGKKLSTLRDGTMVPSVLMQVGF